MAVPKFVVDDIEYTLDDYPYPMRIWYEEVVEVHKLADGSERYYHKGYRVHIRLSWTRNSICGMTTYEKLKRVFNANKCVLFYPGTPDLGDTGFSVRWQGGMNLEYLEGYYRAGYVGNVDLAGCDVLTEIPTTQLG